MRQMDGKAIGAYFTKNESPFFMRGGRAYGSDVYPGIFNFSYGDGSALTDRSLRICLAIK